MARTAEINDEQGIEVRSDRHSLPVSVYDVFGYFVPSITAMSFVFMMERWAASIGGGEFRLLFIPLLESLPSLPEEKAILITIIYGAVAICLLYSMGHIIASFSSLFIDRFLVFRGLGYPYERLITNEIDAMQNNQPLRYSVQCLFVSSNVLLSYAYIKYFFNFSAFVASWGNNYLDVTVDGDLLGLIIGCFGWVLFLILSAYFFVALSVWILELYVFGKPLSDNFIYCNRHLKIVAWVTLPGRIALLILSKLMHRKTQLSDELIDTYKYRFKEVFGIPSEKAQSCNFWFCEMFVMDNIGQARRKLSNWMHLFSFSRNLSTAFFMLFIYGAILLIRNQGFLLKFDGPVGDLTILKAMPLTFLLLSYVMMFRYYYLYSCYYSTYLFRAFLYITRQIEVQRNERGAIIVGE